MYNIFHVEGGIGKNIMATAVLRNICQSFSKNKTIVVAPYLDVFIHNPRIYRLFRTGNSPYFYDDYIKDKNPKIFKLEPYSSPGYLLKKEHLTESWCKIHGLTLDNRGPELYFNKMEDADLATLKQKFSPDKPFIIVQTNGGVGYGENHINFHWFRDVPNFYYQKIIDTYKPYFNFIQIRNNNQMTLQNVIVPSFSSSRECLNLMRLAEGAICIDSLVQHTMAAYGKKSLVCWIGNRPEVFGYKMHTNIKSNFEFELENLEGYLEPNHIGSEGYQCPSNYDPEKLFDQDQLINEFEKLFVKK